MVGSPKAVLIKGMLLTIKELKINDLNGESYGARDVKIALNVYTYQFF